MLRFSLSFNIYLFITFNVFYDMELIKTGYFVEKNWK